MIYVGCRWRTTSSATSSLPRQNTTSIRCQLLTRTEILVFGREVDNQARAFGRSSNVLLAPDIAGNTSIGRLLGRRPDVHAEDLVPIAQENVCKRAADGRPEIEDYIKQQKTGGEIAPGWLALSESLRKRTHGWLFLERGQKGQMNSDEHDIRSGN